MLNKTEFDLTEMIQYFIQKYTPLCLEKSIAMDYTSSDKIMVYADTFKTEQILSNYISNAINYIESPFKIQISVVDYDSIHIRISITNTATPIPEDVLPKLWDSFYKQDESRTRESGGHGLGLSIVKAIQIADNNGYGVTCKNNEVTFYFDLDKSSK
jgi:signal transduction histidine kinase